ncbi:MAG: hypothetical protein RL154_988, partial [Pseudomonadota bacterium]
MSYNKYYLAELDKLKNLGAEFAKKYPGIAPMLSGASYDPDVERLLEGVAFLTGLLHRKLDDNFPEFIHNIADIVFPHFLRVLPSATIMEFKPKPTLKERFFLEKGSSVASNKINGQTTCVFKTTFDLVTYP